jgi:hypothetical protein
MGRSKAKSTYLNLQVSGLYQQTKKILKHSPIIFIAPQKRNPIRNWSNDCMKCMHGQHLLTLSNAFFKFPVFELYKKKI